MLFAMARPSLRTAIPTIILLGIVLTFGRLRYDEDFARRWFRKPPPTLASLQHPGVSKTIVMGALAKEDTSWVSKELPDWNRAIYVTDAKEAGVRNVLTVPRNKGNEANVYLHHIIENYHNLSDVMVFLHSHRDWSWHIDNKLFSNPFSVQHLHLDAILQQGYVNLRCSLFPGCPAGLQLDWNETGTARLPEPPNEIKTVHVMPAAFNILFPHGLDTANATDNYTTATPPVRPAVIATPCCAQFAVSRDQVLQRPKSDYERYHRWLMDSELDSWTSGRVLEYLWHIIFGREAYWCPNQQKCFAAVYGS